MVAKLLSLEENNVLGMTVLVDDPIKASRGGWVFDKPPPQARQIKDLRELYEYLSPNFKGRCTAPVLVDWKSKQIVSNESSDIVRMLPLLSQANMAKSTSALDLYPADLASKIDETNEWVYRLLNNGVYRCGFSTSQQAYQNACRDVLVGLNRVEDILNTQPFLCGANITESDIMLLPVSSFDLKDLTFRSQNSDKKIFLCMQKTMLRFDGVYSPLFGAGGKHLRLECDYPSTFQWLKRCWQMDGVVESIDIADACSSYYRQLFPLNPGGILPSSPTASSLRLED